MTSDRPTGEPVPKFTAPPRPGPARIKGLHVTLERLDPGAHGHDIIAAAEGADWIWDYLGYGPFADAAAWQRWALPMAAATDPFFYAIRKMGNAGAADGGAADGRETAGKVLGQASYLRIEPAHGVIELGHILLTPPLQRTVAATEALMLMIGWAMQAGYRRFEWKCDALNAPSRRAALRLGFTFEGVFRQHMITKGRNRDTAWFSITDREWPALKSAHDAWLAPQNFDAAGQQRRSLSDLTLAARQG